MRALLIANSHGLDLLLTLVLLQRYDIVGESNVVAHAIYLAAGLGGFLLLKTVGIAAMIWVSRGSRFRFAVATLGGLVPAAINVTVLAR